MSGLTLRDALQIAMVTFATLWIAGAVVVTWVAVRVLLLTKATGTILGILRSAEESGEFALGGRRFVAVGEEGGRDGDF